MADDNSGFMGGIFKSLDPTTLILGSLGLMKAPQQQTRESFSDPGSITDPKQALYQALQSVYRMGAGLEQRKPTQLRSSYVQAPPEPISIPGLPFQIGGGMGRDPALANPDLLTSHGLDGVMDFGPFQGIAQRTFQGKVK